MKKEVKFICIAIAIIVVLGIIFYIFDYNRIKNNKTPIFCINSATYMDGGSKEYLGLGYKVIDFNRTNGYDVMKIGTWFMNYEDFIGEYGKID